MPTFRKASISVPRKTYLHGEFRGKFAGNIDLNKSDLVHENFFDLDLLDGEVDVEHENLRRHEDGEHESFREVERFPRPLFSPLVCNLKNADGRIEYFNVSLHEPKLLEPKVINQVYEGNRLFTTIVGTISGYLLDHKIEEIEVEVPDPEPEIPADPIPYTPTFESGAGYDWDSDDGNEDNEPGEISSTDDQTTGNPWGGSGCATTTGGCFEGCGTIIALGIGLLILWALCSGVWNVFRTPAGLDQPSSPVSSPSTSSGSTSVGRTGRFKTNQHIRTDPSPYAPSRGIHFQNATFQVLEERRNQTLSGKSVWYRVQITNYGCDAEDPTRCGKGTSDDSDAGWLNAKYVALDP